MQNVACLVEDVERCKACVLQFRNLVNADIRNPFDVEAAQLLDQGGYLLQAVHIIGSGGRGLFVVWAVRFHSARLTLCLAKAY